jgi:hypothetical protein
VLPPFLIQLYSFILTLQLDQFLGSRSGPQGPQGVTGQDGADGATGPQGSQGVAGQDAIGNMATVCDGTTTGMIRYNTDNSTFEGCDGTSWVQLGPPPALTAAPPLNVVRGRTAAVLAEGRIYVLGGFETGFEDGDDELGSWEVSSLDMSTWTITDGVGELDDRRGNLIADFDPVTRKIYAMGGSKKNDSDYQNDVYYYDLSDATPVWTKISGGDLSNDVEYGGDRLSVGLDRKILFARRDTIQLYDMATETHETPWSFPNEPDVPDWDTLGRVMGASLATDGRYLFVTGGKDSNNDDYFSYFSIFDMQLDEWFRGPDLILPRYDHSAEVVGDYLYLFGGKNSTTIFDSIIKIYIGHSDLKNNIGSSSWSTENSTLTAPKWGMASIVKDGRVSLIGGFIINDNNYSDATNAVDLFNPN